MSNYINGYFPRKANLFPFIDEILGAKPANWSSNSEFTIPSVNVKETETDFKIEMAIPGQKKEDLKISVEENVLTISCEKKENIEENKDCRYTRREYRYHSFSRTFTLPETCETDKISASYEDGILSVSLPKKEITEAIPSKKVIQIQ